MGSQPAPRNHIKSSDVLNYLISEIINISSRGKLTYGTRLRTFNGRNALMDALEESIDQSFYIKQKLMEFDEETKDILLVISTLEIGDKKKALEVLREIIERRTYEEDTTNP